ncbi:MAG TPA: hypothetical protein VLT33_32685, partial [Labilithrix sp.]|nr:hypothetical protein [Labilithrix sp.]
MGSRSALLVVLVGVLVTLAMPRVARATEPDATDVAREEYARGNALAKATQWGEALSRADADATELPP